MLEVQVPESIVPQPLIFIYCSGKHWCLQVLIATQNVLFSERFAWTISFFWLSYTLSPFSFISMIYPFYSSCPRLNRFGFRPGMYRTPSTTTSLSSESLNTTPPTPSKFRLLSLANLILPWEVSSSLMNQSFLLVICVEHPESRYLEDSSSELMLLVLAMSITTSESEEAASWAKLAWFFGLFLAPSPYQHSNAKLSNFWQLWHFNVFLSNFQSFPSFPCFLISFLGLESSSYFSSFFVLLLKRFFSF